MAQLNDPQNTQVRVRTFAMVLSDPHVPGGEMCIYDLREPEDRNPHRLRAIAMSLHGNVPRPIDWLAWTRRQSVFDQFDPRTYSSPVSSREIVQAPGSFPSDHITAWFLAETLFINSNAPIPWWTIWQAMWRTPSDVWQPKALHRFFASFVWHRNRGMAQTFDAPSDTKSVASGLQKPAGTGPQTHAGSVATPVLHIRPEALQWYQQWAVDVDIYHPEPAVACTSAGHWRDTKRPKRVRTVQPSKQASNAVASTGWCVRDTSAHQKKRSCWAKVFVSKPTQASVSM
jgi:hypothetical protein